MIVAAAPAPPVPAPPGRPPLAILSSSLRRGSSNWWFSNGNAAHGRDSATASTSSRATRRKWWSDPDGSQEDYGSSSVEEEYDYDYDYEDEDAFGFGGAGELFDEPWFSKVYKTYGFLLPVMLVSMFAATGTKAFLMAIAFPLGQSAISFLLNAVWGRKNGNRDERPRRRVQEEDYPEDATDFATGGRGNRYSGSSSYYEGRRGSRSYQSRVSEDFVDAASTAVGADDSTMSSSSGDGWGGNKSSGGGYGGWDELLNNNTDAAQEAKRSSNGFSAGNTGYSTKSRPSATGEEDADYTAAAGSGRRVEQGVGAPPERMRRRRMPRTMGLGSTRYKQAPLLMRLLVAVFPFMGSWFRL